MIVKEKKKFPVFAGMQFCKGKTINNNIKEVGYKIIEFTFDVIEYPTHKDFCLISEKTIKTVMHL